MDPAIRFQDTTKAVRPDQLAGGFWVNWPNPPPPEAHLRILQGSSDRLLAIDSRTEQVVGFITAITDGVLAAYIPLLEVLPEYQGQGIGSALTERMLARLADYYMVDLLCDEDVQPYYERFGMLRAQGMVRRNYAAQAGRPANDL